MNILQLVSMLEKEDIERGMLLLDKLELLLDDELKKRGLELGD